MTHWPYILLLASRPHRPRRACVWKCFAKGRLTQCWAYQHNRTGSGVCDGETCPLVVIESSILMWLLLFSHNTQNITHSPRAHGLALPGHLLNVRQMLPGKKVWGHLKVIWLWELMSTHVNAEQLFKIYLSGLLTLRLQAQTYPSWANWLTPNATAQAGSCLQPLPVLWCYLLRSASWLPFQSELFFLWNFLFVRRVLPPIKEIGYLVSDVLIFLEKFLGSLKTPPFLPPWVSL